MWITGGQDVISFPNDVLMRNAPHLEEFADLRMRSDISQPWYVTKSPTSNINGFKYVLLVVVVRYMYMYVYKRT